MDRFTLILRQIVFFLFPMPFLVGYGAENWGTWEGTVAAIAAAVLLLVSIAAGYSAFRRGR